MMKTLEGEMGVIVLVDTTNYTCTVRTEYGLHRDVPITPVFLSPNGKGMWFLPEVGTRVLVGTVGKGTTNEYSFLIGAAFAVDKDPFDTEADAISDTDAKEEVANPDFRNNRPILQTGDIVLSSSDRNFIVMRKGGIVEIGATQIAKRFYIPLQNVIRDIAQGYELQNSAGLLQMVRKESDRTWGKKKIEIPAPAPNGEVSSEVVEVDKVPTEFNLRVREYESDDAPIVSIDLGSITRTTIAEEGLGDDSKGNKVHPNFVEFDQNNDLAHLVARLNINNRVKVFIDRNGNYTSEVFGAEIHTHTGPRFEEIFNGNYVGTYSAGFSSYYRQVDEEIGETRTTRIGESDTSFIGSADNPETTWKIAADGAELTTQGAVDIRGGKTKVEADGLLELKAGSDVSISCDNLVISTMGALRHVYAGSVSNTCLNSEGENVSYQIINESAGEMQIHNTLGAIRLSSQGRPSSGGQAGSGSPGLGSVSEILIKPNGTIRISFLAGGVVKNSIEVNATGCSLQTAGGELSIDNAGNVNLGGAAAGAGNGRVVTTLTHPVCFVTGAPINGSTKVGAASIGLAPGPMLPTLFVKDPS